MASLPIFDRAGTEVGRYEVDPAEFAETINKQLLHDVVVMYQANKRQGSFRSRSRAEVASSNKKMYRQKGTGNARAGHRRSGVRRGGGHIFAKRPRDFTYRLNKKVVRMATRMAIASRIEDDEVLIVDELSFPEPKTSDMANLLKALGLEGQSALVATAERDVNVYKSCRNIQRLTVSPISDLNALLLLSPRRVILTKAAADAMRERAKTS